MKYAGKWLLVCLIIAASSFSVGYSTINTEKINKKAANCVSVGLFRHADFAGSSSDARNYNCVDAAGYYTLGNFNNQVSAIIVDNGKCIRVFDGQHYTGASTVFCGTVPYVGNAWNDRIESMRME